MCPCIVEDGQRRRRERLFEDDAGKIGMPCGSLNREIGAEVFTNENDGIDRYVPGSGQIVDCRIGVFAPSRFTGMRKAALPISAIVEGKNIES